jgi:hypothetical protein
MKSIALAVGLLVAFSANAQGQPRAKFVSSRTVSTFPGTPILVCRYAGRDATYEVVASAASCAPYLDLN